MVLCSVFGPKVVPVCSSAIVGCLFMRNRGPCCCRVASVLDSGRSLHDCGTCWLLPQQPTPPSSTPCFHCYRRSAEARDTGGVQQLMGLLAAEGFSLPFPLEDVPQRLADMTVIEREGKVGGQRVPWDQWIGRLGKGARPDGQPQAAGRRPGRGRRGGWLRKVCLLLIPLPPQVLGCAAIRDLGSSPDGVRVRGSGWLRCCCCRRCTAGLLRR